MTISIDHSTNTLGNVLNYAATQTIASAATTNIAGATSNSVIVSGTTTITALGTVAAGAERMVQFSGALILTHNATSLILPGGANITTAAGDVAYFVSLGSGNWRCSGYQKANGTSVVAGGVSLASVTSATGANTLTNNDNAQTWQWALTTAAKSAFKFTESAASTNGAGSQYLVDIGTLAASTASPLRVQTRGSDTIAISNNGGITLSALSTAGAAAPIVTINGGISNAAQSGNTGGIVLLAGAAGAVASVAGGPIVLTGGAGSTTTTGGVGGAVSMTGGAGGLAAAGGAATVAGGASGATGTGGDVNITAGGGYQGGNVVIKGGVGTGSGGSGKGEVQLIGGGADTAGMGGGIVIRTTVPNLALPSADINIYVGSGGSSSRAGTLYLAGGVSNGAQSGNSGGIVLTGGAAGATASVAGGPVVLTGGAGSTTTTGGVGGAVTITAGAGGLAAAGGSVTITTGSGGASGAAGSLALNAGTTNAGLSPALTSNFLRIALGSGASTATGSLYQVALGSSSSGSGATTNAAGAVALGGAYASGTDSFAAAIGNNTSTYGAQGNNSVAIGSLCKATATYAVALGVGSNATGSQSVAIGINAVSSQTDCYSIGNDVAASAWNSFSIGYRSRSTIKGKWAYASGYLSAAGDAQSSLMVLRAAPASGATGVLTSDISTASTGNQLVCATSQAMVVTGMIVGKVTGTAQVYSATFTAQVINNGGTLTLGAAVTLQNVIDGITLTTVPTVTADNTNKALAVTSGAKTATVIKWVCTLQSCEITY